MNDDASGIYNTNSQIKFKTKILDSNSCDYIDTYILAKGTKIITGEQMQQQNIYTKEIKK